MAVSVLRFHSWQSQSALRHLRSIPTRIYGHLRVHGNLIKLKLKAELERLTVEYEKEEEIFSSIKIDVKIKRQNAWTLKNQADLIAAELKEAGLNSHARLELEGKHRAYKAEWTDLNVEYEDQQFPRYSKAKQSVMMQRQH
ncbi:hypothetical protein BASA50_004041 [Batrachochytrium salamandrivorans]|uniref:Uncharacterized protein n=1 Tax=Batrachochytrium salamandrivorans TaxID=1357716 RepID=A0ABQ8FH24_9FUNG|nr:hypothetical protein BASA50_004041 [Batrachochytrium salamandrivorans]